MNKKTKINTCKTENNKKTKINTCKTENNYMQN